MLSGAHIIQAIAVHFPARLDAEVSKMASVFAVGTDDFAARVTLCGKGSGGRLKALFLAIAN